MKIIWHNPEIIPESDEFVSITRSQGFSFSSSFMRNNGLTNSTYVRFGAIEDNEYQIACQFSELNDRPSGHWVSLVRKSNRGKTHDSAQTKAAAFINSHFVLKNIVKNSSGSKEARRYRITFEKIVKSYLIHLIPSFEHSCNLDNLPSNEVGIYRCLDKVGEVVYIGKGRIKDRVKEHQHNFNFSTIQYSVINNEQEQFKYEAYYLDLFRSERGRLPAENSIGGKRLD